ncbi:MAG: hypothetical protein KBD01_01735 [Acidobacteria bacterium]|nr:hypothetical protein [Acidobacteriota bacterium]
MTPRRTSVRDALRRAAETTQPDTSRLREAIPWIMAEARRRREARPATILALMAASAWRAVPRLAVATVLALVLASVALLVERGSATAGAVTFESAILGHASGTDESTGDVLLDAVLSAEANNG